MNRLYDAWRPLLLGLVLLSVLVGVAGAVPTHQPSALSTRRQLTIAASDFYPMDDDTRYLNYGHYLTSDASMTDQFFIAPVDFPYPLWVTLDKVELFALDCSVDAEIAATIYLSKPSLGSDQSIASINTGVTDDYPDIPHAWQTTAISPKVKNPADDCYVWLKIGDITCLRLYGVRIFYYVGK